MTTSKPVVPMHCALKRVEDPEREREMLLAGVQEMIVLKIVSSVLSISSLPNLWASLDWTPGIVAIVLTAKLRRL